MSEDIASPNYENLQTFVWWVAGGGGKFVGGGGGVGASLGPPPPPPTQTSVKFSDSEELYLCQFSTNHF